MSTDVTDLHICICIHTSRCLYSCTHSLHIAPALMQPAADPLTKFSGRVDLVSPVCYCMTRSHVTAAVFKIRHDFATLSSQTLLNKNRQCCESWRDAELGVHAVCAGSDTTDEDC